MASNQYNPNTHRPIQDLREYEQVVNRTMREATGLPLYDMDDPERPFTPEYDESLRDMAPVDPDTAEASLPPVDAKDAEDIDAFAQRIAEHAPQVDYPDRTSEAARDQGWGQVDVRRAEKPRPKTKVKRTARFPLHSSKNTRPELDPQAEPVTDEDIAAGTIAIQAMRQTLSQKTS